MKKTSFLALMLAAVIFAAAFSLTSCFNHKHSFADGVCTSCGESDPSYVKVCNHTYKNGVCTQCKEFCTHDFSEGLCKVCGFVCSHNYPYVDGKCSVCNRPCAHVWENGFCKICILPCTHDYDGGVCKACGKDDPDYIPADGGRSLYKDIVDDYVYIITYKNNTEELPPKPDNAPYYTDALYEVGKCFDPSMTLGYSYKDINKDGYVELFLVGIDSRIYGMFTIVDKAPTVVKVFQNGMGYIAPDGMIFYNTNGIDSTTGYYTNQKNHTYLVGDKLVGISYGYHDTDGDLNTNDDMIYFAIGEDGIERTIEKSEYNSYGKFYEHYWTYPTRLNRLSNLRFNPVLIAATISTKTADFSDYAAIVKTLGIMYTEVAGGKFEKFKWTRGDFDLGMRFNSDEDFAIYNSILGAAALLQNSSLLKFGYAEKDLNGDGINELVVMGDKYHVFAIFTLVDGKAVMIDSFSDLRSAFIDEDGNIHVKERIIPGHEDDAEYTVYSIGAIKTTVGISHNDDGTVKGYYKVIDGERIAITADEYNVLYTQYVADLGTSELHTYTKNNSGLTFTQATAA